METYLVYEIIGYAASVLVAVSLMMSAIVKLRIVNMIGAFTFAIYGVLIGSIPVAAMNAFIVLINIYYLAKIYRDREYFQLLRVKNGSDYLNAFLNFHKKSIQTYQPGFTAGNDHNFSLFVLRDMIPAGLLLGSLNENGELNVRLDYVIPNYRDFKIGNYLFNDKVDYFVKQGVRKITSPSGNEDHNRYLEKVGFSRSNHQPDLYELNIDKKS
jgi:hypothetical protein